MRLRHLTALPVIAALLISSCNVEVKEYSYVDSEEETVTEVSYETAAETEPTAEETIPRISTAVAPDNEENFRDYLLHLLEAYTSKDEGVSYDDQLQDDLEAIRAVSEDNFTMALKIGDIWDEVFMDDDYELYIYGQDDPAQIGIGGGSDHAIVVLGYELMNGQMQDELKGRCDAAAALAEALPDSIIICSGGATGPNNREGNTEAGLMRDYLTEECGIDPARIYIDEDALTTAENAVNSFSIMRANDIHCMTIVTSVYHMRWGQADYQTLAYIYSQDMDYDIGSVANFCYDVEPSVDMYRYGAHFAVWQIASIIGLSEQTVQSLSPMNFI